MTKENKKIIGSECINTTYMTDRINPGNDLTMVAEYNWYDDGTEGPSTRFIPNFERPFWVVKKPLRTYEDKHITEKLENCEKRMCNSAQLPMAVQKALGQRPDPKARLAIVNRNQFVYGTDVSTPTIIKKKYKLTWPESVGKGQRNIAALDVETNMLGGEEHIISIGVTLKEHHYLYVWAPFVKGIDNPEEKLQAAYTKYLSDFEAEGEVVDKATGKKVKGIVSRNLIKERNSKLTIKMCKTPGECVVAAYKDLHALPVDFLSIFNIKFDIVKMLEAIAITGDRPENVFSHPRVPNGYRKFYFDEDRIRKETSSGKSTGKHYSDLWHKVVCGSRFYHICPMAVYKQSRVTKADLSDYALDTILAEEVGMRKLKFKEADHLEKKAWHVFMQANFPIEYLIYNIFDCVALELLDEHTKDISNGIVFSTDCSEYAKWGSGPKKLSDSLHFFALSKGEVLGGTSDKMKEVYDDHVPKMNGWIAMLQSSQMDEDGISLFEDAPHLKSKFYANTYDEDVEAAYPSGEDIWNVGRETSRFELCRVKDREERIMRKTGVDLTAGRVNALEISSNMHKAWTLFDIREQFKHLPKRVK